MSRNRRCVRRVCTPYEVSVDMDIMNAFVTAVAPTFFSYEEQEVVRHFILIIRALKLVESGDVTS